MLRYDRRLKRRLVSEFRAPRRAPALLRRPVRLLVVGARGDDPDQTFARARLGAFDLLFLEEIRRPELRRDHGSHRMSFPRIYRAAH